MEGVSLVVILFHQFNGIYGSSIRVSGCILWHVETCLVEPFRDPAYNWFRVLKPKWRSGLNLVKFEKVYLGMVKVIKIPWSLMVHFIAFDSPLQKLQYV